jgi:hypothetical protein
LRSFFCGQFEGDFGASGRHKVAYCQCFTNAKYFRDSTLVCREPFILPVQR